MAPVDGPAFQGELISIADGRAAFRVGEQQGNAGESRVLALDQLVRWGHPVAPKPQAIVVLADGGQILAAADWAGGDVVKLVGEELLVQTELFNQVRLPRAAVRGLVFALRRRVEDREKLVASVRGEPSAPSEDNQKPDADFALLANGDRARGKVKVLASRAVVIEIGGQSATLPSGRVEAIGLAPQNAGGSASPRPQPRGISVGWRDGSMVYVKSVRGTEGNGEIELLDGAKLKGAAADIVALQSLSDRLVYLSDLEKADYRHVPYLSVKWPYTRDRNVLGEPIVVGGNRYWKGIGMHSAARLTYAFDREYRRFDSSVAIDDSAKGRGSVVFGVYVNRDGKWVEAYRSKTVRGGEKPVHVSVDLRGAKGLTLTVDFADRGDELDHAVWLDARLVK